MAGAVTQSATNNNTTDASSASYEFFNYHGYSHTLQYFPPCGGGDPITTVAGTMIENNEEENHHHKFNKFINHNSNMATTADTMTFPSSYLQDFASPTGAEVSSTTEDNNVYHERFTTALMGQEADCSEDHYDDGNDGKRKKPGQQKRSWNTENYQWMNIKRRRKVQRSEGKYFSEYIFIQYLFISTKYTLKTNTLRNRSVKYDCFFI